MLSKFASIRLFLKADRIRTDNLVTKTLFLKTFFCAEAI